MGRPANAKSSATTTSATTGTSRRSFFKRSSAAAAAAAGLAPASMLAHASSADRVLFQHGVASGDPLPDRVILWTRVSPSTPRSVVPVRYVVATDPLLRQVVLRGSTSALAQRDYTVKVDAEGLLPATTYYYRFFADDASSAIGRTRTAPVGPTARLRIAVVSCSNHAYGYFNAYRSVARRADLDLVIHLGDYLYEYGPDQYGSVRSPEPPNEIITLSDYRLRHAQYKRDADLQVLHRQHPMVAIWDDHEIANDSWRGGAENHTEGVEGSWRQRVNEGLQAYYEWMPVRVPDPSRVRRNQRAFQFGNLIDLVMLEERLSARSIQLPGTIPTPFGNGFVQSGEFANPERTLLGKDQEAWLASRLRESTARWKFIGQGVMFAPLKLVPAPLANGGGVFLNSDQWDGYQPARDRLFGVFKGDASHAGVDNCVVLTGDIHTSWVADLTQDPNNPDVVSGGYDAATGDGSHAVEFVGMSVTSPGLDDPDGSIASLLRGINPHFKFIDLNRRGYLLLDVTPARVVGEFWYVDTVASVSNVETFGAAFETLHGSNRVQASTPSRPRTRAPALAP